MCPSVQPAVHIRRSSSARSCCTCPGLRPHTGDPFPPPPKKNLAINKTYTMLCMAARAVLRTLLHSTGVLFCWCRCLLREHASLKACLVCISSIDRYQFIGIFSFDRGLILRVFILILIVTLEMMSTRMHMLFFAALNLALVTETKRGWSFQTLAQHLYTLTLFFLLALN